MRNILLVVALSLCGYAWSDAPTPAPLNGGQQPKEKLHKSQQITIDDKRGTEEVPFVVKNLPTEIVNVKTDNDIKNEKDKFHLDIVLAVSTFVLVLVTAALAKYTRKLWGATSKLVEEGRDTAKKQLRAYVSCASKEMIFLSDIVLRAEVEFRNSGQTPAHNFRYAINGGIFSPKEIPEFSEPNFVPHSQPIAPNASWTVGHEFRKFSEADIQDIIFDRKLVYIWGKAEYKDMFSNDPQIIKFRFRNVVKHGTFDSHTGNMLQIKAWSFYPEEEGNEST